MPNSPLPLMDDQSGFDGPHRRELRVETLKAGRLVFDHNDGIDCFVRDYSAVGARIQLADDIPVRKAKGLCFYPENIEVPVRVAWQRGSSVGIEFTNRINNFVTE